MAGLHEGRVLMESDCSGKGSSIAGHGLAESRTEQAGHLAASAPGHHSAAGADLAGDGVLAALDLQAPTDPRPGIPRSRLEFDNETRSVALDGRWFANVEPLAYKRFRAIAEASSRGERLPDNKLGAGRIGRHLRRHLPAELFALLDRRGGKNGGSCLTLPRRSP